MLKTYISMKNGLPDLKDHFVGDESGASLIEYTLLLGIITVGAIATIGLVGTWVSTEWTTLQGKLPAAG